MTRTALGEVEHHVLLALLHLGGEAYSAPIVLELEERSGRTVSPAAVYIALRRLEDKGLVTSRKESKPPEGGGRRRRVFTISDTAVEQLRLSRQRFERLWKGLDPVFHDPT